ncbi:hypothetical protein AAFF_G00094260 [Aldrovandia affinis]|uniref:Uncharacterized protein n=1 Tax=Aldrovandia affinis TaxID=143900 RepID=A0AAD7WY84_9TELE|nr:hypothetical protein AAFF_G00094260 [Aldrovandia affinis]
MGSGSALFQTAVKLWGRGPTTLSSASQDSDIARAVARELSPNFHQPGLEYIKQAFTEPLEIPEEIQEEKSPSKSPHFYQKGTTPTHSPAQSPSTTPPPSPHKNKHQLTNSTAAARKLSKEERPAAADVPPARIAKEPSGTIVRQEVVPPKAPKKPEPPPHPGNGQLHSQYHSYYVKAEVKIPPPEPADDEEPELTQLALARMPPPPKQLRAGTPKPTPAKDSKPEPKLRKQDSLKPKSLAETKKASMEISDIVEEEPGPNSILGNPAQ